MTALHICVLIKRDFSDLDINQNSILNLAISACTNIKSIGNIKAIFKNVEIRQAGNLHNTY